MSRSYYLDITNEKYNHLTALYPTDKKEGSATVWHCRCDCGNEVDVGIGRLRYGSVKTCGKCEYHLEGVRKCHELWHTPLEKALAKRFRGILKRCYNPRCKAYPDYGGRGILVCDEWLKDRRKFVEWGLANGFRPELSIDRIDVNKGYSPDNCRWVTDKVQGNNKRDNVYVTVGHRTHTITQWSILIDRPLFALYRLSQIDDNGSDLTWYIRTRWERLCKTQQAVAEERLKQIEQR